VLWIEFAPVFLEGISKYKENLPSFVRNWNVESLRKTLNKWLFVFIAIGWAVSIHTVTAFLYVGLGGRPFWNSAIIAPRFLASAFAAGPAFLVLTLQVIYRAAGYKLSEGAINLLKNIITIALTVNMFLIGCELFTEFYGESTHIVSLMYLYLGLHGYHALVPWIWTAISLCTVALIILYTPLAKKLVYVTTDLRGQYFHGPDNPIGVYQKTPANIHASILFINSISRTDAASLVGEHWKRHASIHHFGKLFLLPYLVAEPAVGAYRKYLYSEVLEFPVPGGN